MVFFVLLSQRFAFLPGCSSAIILVLQHVDIRRSMRRSTSALQSGQLALFINHLSVHSWWNRCLHLGRTLYASFSSKLLNYSSILHTSLPPPSRLLSCGTPSTATSPALARLCPSEELVDIGSRQATFAHTDVQFFAPSLPSHAMLFPTLAFLVPCFAGWRKLLALCAKETY